MHCTSVMHVLWCDPDGYHAEEELVVDMHIHAACILHEHSQPVTHCFQSQKKNQSVKAPHRNRHWPQHAAPVGIARVCSQVCKNAMSAG